MCIFCAAIPLSATVGAAASGKQHQQRTDHAKTSDDPAPRAVPALKITAAVTGGLIVCSAVYHLVIYPHTGIVL